MLTRRLKDLAAIVLIGDGVVGAVAPRRHSLLWRSGPAGYRALIGWFAQRPVLTRVLAVAEAAAGLWFALRQYEE